MIHQLDDSYIEWNESIEKENLVSHIRSDMASIEGIPVRMEESGGGEGVQWVGSRFESSFPPHPASFLLQTYSDMTCNFLASKLIQ